MNIDLIYPGFLKIGFNTFGAGGMDNNWLNIGLLSIATILKNQGHTVRILDIRCFKDWGNFEESIKTGNAELIGIHVNTPNFDSAKKCAEIAKKYNKIVVGGGVHATLDPESLINTGFFDYVITREGEITFPDIINRIEKGETISQKIIEGESVADLDTLPIVDRSFYDIKKVIHSRGGFPFLDHGIAIMASRGCPYKCAFCQPLIKNHFGSKIRYRSVENVIKEIKYLIDTYDVGYISFQDDTFTVRKEWVLELCKRITEENIDIQWSCQSRVNTFDEELAAAMKKAGCACIFFGFESGSQKILDFLEKQITPEQSIKAANICKKYKIIILADYMFGAPDETEDDLKATYDLIVNHIKPEIHIYTYFTPIPGSKLYEYCKTRQIMNIQNMESFDRAPIGEKIKGIDYDLIKKYQVEILKKSSQTWLNNKTLFSMAIKRWKYMLSGGYKISEIIEDMIISSNISLRTGLFALWKKSKSIPKKQKNFTITPSLTKTYNDRGKRGN